MVQGCILSMSVSELTILPGLPGLPGAPLKPISPFGMSRGGTGFSKKVEQQTKLQHGTFFLPDLLHYPQPRVTHPNRSDPERRITRQETNHQHIPHLNFFVC